MSDLILVPVDFEEGSKEALRRARELARPLGATLVLVHVFRAPFYVYPDLEPHREQLRDRHGVEGGTGLATALLDGPGIATLPGSAFGDNPSALRLRVATSRLYGGTPEQREEALLAEDPLDLPWISDQLVQLRDGLGQLIG